MPGVRWRAIAANAVTALASVVIGYLIAGSLLLLFGPALAPQLFNAFPRAATIWWQASAPAPDEQPYIAILGDSYAAGMGDWNVERSDGDAPCYSGDVIAAQLSRPVLSYGKGGASSAEAMVLLPTRIMNAGRCLLFYDPLPPDALVVYFYEGNDLRDNVKDMREAPGIEPGQTGYARAVVTRLEAIAESEARGQCLRYIVNAVANLSTGLKKSRRYRAAEPEPARGQPVRIAGTEAWIPDHLQAPVPDLDAAEIEAGFVVLEESLRWLRNRFPEAALLMVHIPAVLTTYQLTADTVTVQRLPEPLPRQRITARSDCLCRQLREITLRHGGAFLDARPALRAAGRRALIHGPKDWKHLNRVGQTALGELVAETISGGERDSGCTDLAT